MNTKNTMLFEICSNLPVKDAVRAALLEDAEKRLARTPYPFKSASCIPSLTRIQALYLIQESVLFRQQMLSEGILADQAANAIISRFATLTARDSKLLSLIQENESI